MGTNSWDSMTAETAAACADSIWEGTAIRRSALAIGIPIGPDAAEKPFDKAADKYLLICKEIGSLGLPLSFGIKLHRLLASFVLSYVGQIYETSKETDNIIRRGFQAICHLPENGFSKIVLRNLEHIVPLGCPHTVAVLQASKVGSAFRLERETQAEVNKLENVFRDNDYRPLSVLSSSECFRFLPLQLERRGAGVQTEDRSGAEQQRHQREGKGEERQRPHQDFCARSR